MWRYIVMVVLALSAVRHVATVCNQCKNGFTCVSETEFQLCFSGEPDTSITYSCPNADDVCSQYGDICRPRDTVVPACRGIQNCVCDEMQDFYFVCTSRTTFTMCLNQTYSATRGTCKENQLCDVERGKEGEIPCTTKCIDEVVDASLCDFQNPVDVIDPGTTVTPTTVTPTTVTPTTVTPTTVTPTTVTPTTVTPTTVTPTTVTPTTVTPTTVTPTTVTPTTVTPTTVTPTTVTPTTVTPTTSTTVIITPTPPDVANAVCSTQTSAGRYPLPNDTVCTHYAFCYWDSDQLRGTRTACPTGRYFNRNIRNCQATKPSWCV